MKTTFVSAALLTAALALGCSSSDEHHPTAGSSGTTGTPQDPATPPAGTAKGLIIDQVLPMTGGLHVTWTNHGLPCEAVELERKTPTEAYKVAFKVDGEADNKHDSTATNTATTYTYRARCKDGESYSAYSNEMSGSPK